MYNLSRKFANCAYNLILIKFSALSVYVVCVLKIKKTNVLRRQETMYDLLTE